jgi:hypothetical protein
MVFRSFYRRTFLNLPGHHAGAYALAAVDVKPGYATGKRVNAGLSIADCGRVVHLEFDADCETTARNALHKAILLRDILDAFTEALEQAIREAEL